MIAREKRVVAVDGLRGVAILMVMLYHLHAWMPGLEKLPDWYMGPMSLGFSGVDLFFVLSGFSLYYAWMRQELSLKKVSAKNYYWRRFWRIYPPYIIAFVVPWLPIFLATPMDALWEAFLHVFLIHNYSETHFYGANGPLWSIAVEAQFYVLFPFIIALTRRWSMPVVVIGGIVLGLLYRTGVYLYFEDYTYRQVPKPYLQGFWLARIPNFLLGMWLAAGWKGAPRLDKLNNKKAYGLFVMGVGVLGVTWAMVFLFRHGSMVFRELGFALGYVLIVFGVLKGAARELVESKWLTFTGRISYSLYLTHAPVLLLLGGVVRDYFGDISLIWGFSVLLVGFGVSYGVAIAYHRMVEVPFFNYAKTFS